MNVPSAPADSGAEAGADEEVALGEAGEGSLSPLEAGRCEQQGGDCCEGEGDGTSAAM
ncbi:MULTISPECIES: hypothetical protein [unclassified Streptomyces]|uniref:hypothetical protein n=1 Tax=unclassified Streptomyces TaxID=2593676 RepID=UPI00224F87DD|nr:MULTISPECIES: hypothetical protein [unclassified Streptomyces]MCX5328679.1 hypothetical protein [Streptomyces sp. NBC_00140]MCX5358092.1 hypothetical protein [Streptomyces sp. NBC_00124]